MKISSSWTCFWLMGGNVCIWVMPVYLCPGLNWHIQTVLARMLLCHQSLVDGPQQTDRWESVPTQNLLNKRWVLFKLLFPRSVTMVHAQHWGFCCKWEGINMWFHISCSWIWVVFRLVGVFFKLWYQAVTAQTSLLHVCCFHHFHERQPHLPWRWIDGI